MVKEKKILYYFLYWFLTLATVCIIGISDVFALTYNDIGYVSEQTNMMIEVSYETESGAPLTIEWGQHYQTQIKVMYINVSKYQFNANVHYQLEMYFPDMQITNGNYYEVYDGNLNQCEISYTYSSFGSQYPRWDFQCPNNTNEITIKIANNENTAITEMGNFYWAYGYLRYTNADIDSTGSEIADNIINNNNQNTDKVIENNNQNTDKIIESNKETQEVIKDQFNSCRDSINLFDIEKWVNSGNNSNYYSYENGKLVIKAVDIRSIQDFTENDRLYLPNGTYYLSNFDPAIGRIYNNDTNSPVTINEFTVTKGYIYLKLVSYEIISIEPMINKGNTELPFEPYGEKICTNKLDEQNETLQGIQGALTDSSSPDISGLENSAGWLPAGPLDSILNLPLTMLNSLINSLGKTCTPLNLTLPYVNSQIQIPCLSAIFAQITGVNGLWTWVGTIASVLILYNYLLNLYAWVDRVLTLRAEFDEAMGADLANWGRL